MIMRSLPKATAPALNRCNLALQELKVGSPDERTVAEDPDVLCVHRAALGQPFGDFEGVLRCLLQLWVGKKVIGGERECFGTVQGRRITHLGA